MIFRPNFRMGKKCDLSDCGMIVGAREGGLNISETANLLVFSGITVSGVCREWSEKQKTSTEKQFCVQKCVVNMREVSGEGPDSSKLSVM